MQNAQNGAFLAPFRSFSIQKRPLFGKRSHRFRKKVTYFLPKAADLFGKRSAAFPENIVYFPTERPFRRFPQADTPGKKGISRIRHPVFLPGSNSRETIIFPHNQQERKLVPPKKPSGTGKTATKRSDTQQFVNPQLPLATIFRTHSVPAP